MSDGRTGGGFAKMSREKHRELSARGGRAAQAKGTSHRFTSDEAREAGRIGALAKLRYARERTEDKNDG